MDFKPIPWAPSALLLAALLPSWALLACTSSNAAPPEAASDGGSADGATSTSGGAYCPPEALATFPIQSNPGQIIADATGLVMWTGYASQPPSLDALVPGAALQILYTPTFPEDAGVSWESFPFIEALAADAKTVFFDDLGGGISSVPRTGGAVTALTTESMGLWGADATNVYGLGQATYPAGNPAHTILSLPKTGGTPATIYSTPNEIDGMYFDGAIFYWVESDIGAPTPTELIRTAPAAATLTPTTVQTLPSDTFVEDLVGQAGTVVYTESGASGESGPYLLAPGGSVIAVPQGGTQPAIHDGVVYFVSNGAIGTINLDGSPSTTTVKTELFSSVESFAVGPTGSVYYASRNCLYQAAP